MKYINIYASYDEIKHNKEVDLNYHEQTKNHMRIIDKIFYFYMYTSIATDREWSLKKYIKNEILNKGSKGESYAL